MTRTTATAVVGARVPATGGRQGWSRRLWGGAISLAALVAAWAFLAPPQLGGPTSYAITSGISMLPHFHAGDLVVLRKQGSYHVGEVAAYHNGQLGVVVMHRIVAVHGNHYVFKGDNNNYADSFEPTKAQIVGAEKLHLPGAGRYVQELHRPVIAAVALATLWLLSFWRPARSRRHRRRHRNEG